MRRLFTYAKYAAFVLIYLFLSSGCNRSNRAIRAYEKECKLYDRQIKKGYGPRIPGQSDTLVLGFQWDMTQEQVETHLTDLVKQGKIKEQGLDYIITIDLSLYDRKNNKWTDVQPVDFTLRFLYYCNDIMGSIFLEEISDSGKLNTLSIDGHLDHRLHSKGYYNQNYSGNQLTIEGANAFLTPQQAIKEGFHFDPLGVNPKGTEKDTEFRYVKNNTLIRIWKNLNQRVCLQYYDLSSLYYYVQEQLANEKDMRRQEEARRMEEANKAEKKLDDLNF